MAKDEKLSFSFSSKSSSAATKRKRLQSFDQDPAVIADTNPQFVTEFDPSQTLASSSAASKPVIAPIPNNDFRKKMKTLPLPDTSQPDEATRFVVAVSDSSAATDNVTYGLTLRSNPNPNPNSAPDLTPRQEDLTLKRFKEDMQTLPDDRGMDEFKDISIEDFGAAILAGYGWKEGEGLGRNKKADTKVVQYDRRAGTQGIGYDPSEHDVVKVKSGKGSVYKVNKNKAREPAKRVVRIVSGVHIGKKGEVLKKVDGSEVVLKLVDSGDEVRVDEDMIAELGSEVEERCLRKLKELEDFERKEKSGRRREKGDDKRGHGLDRRIPVRWLKSHIRVRVISKDFKGGKWYLKKGEVVDVVGPTTCDISMDGSKELVQSVDQDILETALPKHGGSVLVLYGRHKGVYGNLVERDMEEETGVVRDADSHDLINVRLEQIAEYVGDPSYLGYES